jgi:hypothetical protein
VTKSIDQFDDLIDIRDVIERFEELENLDLREDTDADDFKALGDLLDELKGYGGDEQWRGDWYPITLIRDSHFQDYAQDLVEEIGDWPKSGIPNYIEVDWEATVRNIQQDYSSVDFVGITYWYR